MINIDINNYEEYCIDYIEGTMNAEIAIIFNAFLDNHPEIRAQLADFEIVPLLAEPVVYQGKNLLKKGALVNSATFDEQCFEYIEGNMTTAETKAFESSVANNKTNARTLKLWKATRLIPEQITFANKSSLRRRNILPQLLRWSAAAAVVAFGIFMVTNNLSKEDNFSNNIRWDNAAQEISDEQATLERIYQKLGVNPLRKTNEPYMAEATLKNANGSAKTQKTAVAAHANTNQNEVSARTDIEMQPMQPKRVKIKPEVILVSNGLDIRQTNKKNSTNNTNNSDIESIQDQLARRYNELKNTEISVDQSTVYSAIKKVSGNRVSINTNKQGKANRIQIDGGIFAFSIPVNLKK